MFPEFYKDPDARLDYRFDWSPWLDGDIITAASVVEADEVVVDSLSFTASTVTMWITGGVIGRTHPVTCRIETADGRIDDRTILLICREK